MNLAQELSTESAFKIFKLEILWIYYYFYVLYLIFIHFLVLTTYLVLSHTKSLFHYSTPQPKEKYIFILLFNS